MLRELPSELASHVADHGDYERFRGKSVAIIGAGQSALESAALLHEGGADVEVLARQRQVFWLHGDGLIDGLGASLPCSTHPPTSARSASLASSRHPRSSAASRARSST